MSNATGLRNQRISLYARSDVGVDGFVRPAFAFTIERWGLINDASVYSRITDEKVQMKVDAICEFDIATTVPIAGVMTETGSGVYWWIRYVDPQPRTRRVVVGIDRISEEEADVFRLAAIIANAAQGGVAIAAFVQYLFAVEVGTESGHAIVAQVASPVAVAVGAQGGVAIAAQVNSPATLVNGTEGGVMINSQADNVALITSAAQAGASVVAQVASPVAVASGAQGGTYILIADARVTDALDARVTDDGSRRVVD